MKRLSSHFFTYLIGILSGVTLIGFIGVWVVVKAPSWLVIEGEAHKADVAVVLGGGGGSRLDAAIKLYEAGLVNQLLLVDTKKEYWNSMQKRLSTAAKIEEKNLIVLEGSINTYTDASLVLKYCETNDIKSILIVTDPYHTRRALLVFESEFKGSGVDVSVVSSGYYAEKLSPGDNWWEDNATSKVVWGEISKVVLFYFRGISGYVTSKT